MMRVSIRKIAMAMLVTLGAVHASDLATIQVGLSADFNQTGDFLPIGGSYGVSFYVTPGSGTIVGSSVDFEGEHIPKPQDLALDNGEASYSSQSFATEQDLFTAFGNGSYNFSVETFADSYAPVINLGGATFPNTPKITGGLWNAGSLLLAAGANNTLTWDGFSSSSSNDAVTITIFDLADNVVWYSSLTASATSIVLPFNTLTEGQSYSAYLSFVGVQVFEQNSSSAGGATLTGSLTSTTEFAILAVPEPSGLILLGIGFATLVLVLRPRRQ